MSWQDDIKRYGDPIAFMSRRGNGKAPYPYIKETVLVTNGKVPLREVPDEVSKVVVTGNDAQWYEINIYDELKDNFFQVDYTQGIVFFDAKNNGLSLTFEYYGKGAYLTPDSRVYLTNPDYNYQTVNDKFKNVDTELFAQNTRVNTLITNNPQPSEVVDLRIDKNGVVYDVSRDRINAEQAKIETAYIDANGDKFSSLKERIDAEQHKIEEAYKNIDGFSYPSLKERIDAEQEKIDETFKDTSYTSLKKRLEGIDNDIDKINEHEVVHVVNTVSDMYNANFEKGKYVQTLGYYSINDGGGAIYYIDNTSIDASDYTLTNGLFAHIVFGDMINIRQLGAKPDSDSTTAIQNALNLVDDKGGGIVYIPTGKFILSSSLVIYSNTSLILDNSAELFRNHDGYILMNGESTSSFTGYDGNGNIIIKGGLWNGNGANFTTASTVITLGHGENILIEDLTIKDCVNNHALEINSSKNVLIDNCKFLGFKNTTDRDYAEAINIDKATEAGFPAFGSYDNTADQNVTIQNCYFGKSDTTGMTGWGRGIGSHSSDATGDKHSNINIINNKFEDTIQWAIYITHWDDSQIINNRINNCGGGIRCVTATTSMYRINISENNILNTGAYGLANIGFAGDTTNEIRSINVSDNSVYGTASTSVAGIYAAYCNGCKIDGNEIRNCGTDGIIVRYGRYYTVVNNSVVSCAGDGINVWTSVLYSSVTNNQIGYIGLNGIHVVENVDTITVSSNTISGVNGNKTGDADHIRITGSVDRINIIGNVCRDIQTDYIATRALYITSTCTNVNKSGNIFEGIAGGVQDNGVPTVQDSSNNSLLGLLGVFYSKPNFTSNLNTLTDSGIYLSNDQTVRNPYSDSSSAVLHIYISDQSAIQLAIPFARTTGKTLKRRSRSADTPDNNGWSDWIDVATTPIA